MFKLVFDRLDPDFRNFPTLLGNVNRGDGITGAPKRPHLKGYKKWLVVHVHKCVTNTRDMMNLCRLYAA